MRKITIPLKTDSIGQLLDQNNKDNAKDYASRDKIVCKNDIKQMLKDVIKLNRTVNSTSLINLPNYNELKQMKQKRSELIERIWELYCEAKGIEYVKPKYNKKIADMTTEELEAFLKAVNANRPHVTQTMNFNAPIGQQIAHVEKIEANFDKDMKMKIAGAEEAVEVPKELQGEKNESILKKFVEKGLLTDDYQPSNDLSRTQKAVLADRLAELLEIKNKWKFFEPFWGMSSLSSAYTKGLDQKNMAEFIKRIRKV